IGRLGYVIAAMPFHAFFGIVLMMTNTPVAQNFYRTLDLPWLDIAAEQYFAGGIAWAGGELPLLGVVIVLAVQWTKQDKRDARRFDRHEDAGLSDEFSAYNDMLRKLAERDGVVAADSESDAAADSVASSADSSAEAGPETAATRPQEARTRPRAARRRKERTNVSSDSTVREDSSAQSTGLTGGVDIDITGMTCTACARRVEKSLNRIDGATAWVNFATERARVTGLD